MRYKRFTVHGGWLKMSGKNVCNVLSAETVCRAFFVYLYVLLLWEGLPCLLLFSIYFHYSSTRWWNYVKWFGAMLAFILTPACQGKTLFNNRWIKHNKIRTVWSWGGRVRTPKEKYSGSLLWTRVSCYTSKQAMHMHEEWSQTTNFFKALVDGMHASERGRLPERPRGRRIEPLETLSRAWRSSSTVCVAAIYDISYTIPHKSTVNIN